MRTITIVVAVLMLALCTAVLAQKSPSENMLADRHISEHGSTCADCHDNDNPVSNPETEKCLDCHGSYDELAQLTNDPNEEMNPHANHFGPVPCGECHKSHSKSTLFCDQCHSFGTVVP